MAEYMELQTFIGISLIVLGVLAYLAAVDVLTSLPGNFLFFIGVIVLCWGSESNSAGQGFFWMTVASLALILGYVGYVGWKIAKGQGIDG